MKFNFLKKRKNELFNYEGAKAFALNPEMELYSAVVTAALQNNFYESADDRLKRIQLLMDKVDAEFVAKLAVYARNDMYMRTVPLVLSVEMAKRYSGNSLVSKTIVKVVRRADEITELLAYYQMANNRQGMKKLHRLSKQVQKGLSEAFNQFDEYQFAKYDRPKGVRLRDALFLVHPKAKDEAQQVLFDKIASRTLKVPYTWETELSVLGQKSFTSSVAKKKAFTAKWEELIDSEKMGYMALLRNLRNIVMADVSVNHILKVCDRLSDVKSVLNSKQLPFRFLAAYREIRLLNSRYVALVLDALECAVKVSASNIRGFGKDETVVVACDVSGSMQKYVSDKSGIMLFDIGLLMGMMVQSRCRKVISGMFGDKWKAIQLPRTNILANVMEFYNKEGEVGYSTNGYAVIDDLIARRQMVDKVMMFTDTQMWDSSGLESSLQRSWKQYSRMAPNAKLYVFDLAGYGNSPVRLINDKVFLIAGWSDKVFEMLDAIENRVSVIEKIKLLEL